MLNIGYYKTIDEPKFLSAVAGGCGFIGSSLANYFIKYQNQNLYLDNLIRRGSEINLKRMNNDRLFLLREIYLKNLLIICLFVISLLICCRPQYSLD